MVIWGDIAVTFSFQKNSKKSLGLSLYDKVVFEWQFLPFYKITQLSIFSVIKEKLSEIGRGAYRMPTHSNPIEYYWQNLFEEFCKSKERTTGAKLDYRI